MINHKAFLLFKFAYCFKHSGLDIEDKLGTFFPANIHFAAPSTLFSHSLYKVYLLPHKFSEEHVLEKRFLLFFFLIMLDRVLSSLLFLDILIHNIISSSLLI